MYVFQCDIKTDFSKSGHISTFCFEAMPADLSKLCTCMCMQYIAAIATYVCS